MPSPAAQPGPGGVGAEPGGRRDCRHAGGVHEHGTRAAYVADRCRCAPCREANRRQAAARRRAMAYGRWLPFVDAARARRHVEQLREAGMGVDRIVELSGAASGTVRALIYGDTRTGRAVARIRAETEAAILAVPATRPARGALVPAAATHALVADLLAAGYTLPELARRLGRTPVSLAGSLDRPRVRAQTATEVARLHRELLDSPAVASAQVPRPRTGAGPMPPAVAAVEAAAGRPQGQPDVQLDVQVDIDETAVRRAIAGEPLELTLAEQIEAVRQLVDAGMSVRRIAVRLGTSARTVSRRKAAAAVA